MISYDFMWNLRNKTNEQTKRETNINTENKLMIAGVGSMVGRRIGKMDEGGGRYRLPVMR